MREKLNSAQSSRNFEDVREEKAFLDNHAVEPIDGHREILKYFLALES